MKKICIIILAYLILLPVADIRSQEVLNLYILEGLENNLVLKEKNIELERSLLALKDAKSVFLPSLDFAASYNLAEGGRSIDIPIGDLLNGVYSTLNQLTGTNQFPQLDNISEQFLPNDFYDARLRVSMPLLNRDITYQKQIREKQTLLSEYEIRIYKANLIQDIKIAYYNFCTASTAIDQIKNSKGLVEQNLKDTQSLLENGKGLPSAVLRAESEIENINALLIEAENRRKNAENYVNFLLNRPISSEVIFEKQSADFSQLLYLNEENDLSLRPELLQLTIAESIQETAIKSGKNYWVPKINTFMDFGGQGFGWEVTKNGAYALFGINLSVPIYHGGRNQNQILRSELGLQSVQNQKNLLNNQLSLELQVTKNEIQTNQAALQSAEKKMESSAAYFRLVDRGFKEGTNSLIEFIDARSQLTQASLQKTITSYNLLRSLAMLERQLTTETY